MLTLECFTDVFWSQSQKFPWRTLYFSSGSLTTPCFLGLSRTSGTWLWSDGTVHFNTGTVSGTILFNCIQSMISSLWFHTEKVHSGQACRRKKWSGNICQKNSPKMNHVLQLNLQSLQLNFAASSDEVSCLVLEQSGSNVVQDVNDCSATRKFLCQKPGQGKLRPWGLKGTSVCTCQIIYVHLQKSFYCQDAMTVQPARYFTQNVTFYRNPLQIVFTPEVCRIPRIVWVSARTSQSTRVRLFSSSTEVAQMVKSIVPFLSITYDPSKHFLFSSKASRLVFLWSGLRNVWQRQRPCGDKQGGQGFAQGYPVFDKIMHRRWEANGFHCFEIWSPRKEDRLGVAISFSIPSALIPVAASFSTWTSMGPSLRHQESTHGLVCQFFLVGSSGRRGWSGAELTLDVRSCVHCF